MESRARPVLYEVDMATPGIGRCPAVVVSREAMIRKKQQLKFRRFGDRGSSAVARRVGTAIVGEYCAFDKATRLLHGRGILQDTFYAELNTNLIAYMHLQMLNYFSHDLLAVHVH